MDCNYVDRMVFGALRTSKIEYYVGNDNQYSMTKDITNAVESYIAMDAPKYLNMKIDETIHILEWEDWSWKVTI